MRGRICLSSPPTGLDAHSQKCAQPTVPGHALAPRPASHLAASTTEVASAHQRPRARHLAVQTISGGIGISTDCPSPTAFALGLGPTNPPRMTLAAEPSDLRRQGFSPCSRYSSQHSHFQSLQSSSPSTFSAMERSSTKIGS